MKEIEDIEVINSRGLYAGDFLSRNEKLLYVPYHNFRGLYHEECTNRIGLKGYHMSFG